MIFLLIAVIIVVGILLYKLKGCEKCSDSSKKSGASKSVGSTPEYYREYAKKRYQNYQQASEINKLSGEILKAKQNLSACKTEKTTQAENYDALAKKNKGEKKELTDKLEEAKSKLEDTSTKFDAFKNDNKELTNKLSDCTSKFDAFKRGSEEAKATNVVKGRQRH